MTAKILVYALFLYIQLKSVYVISAQISACHCFSKGKTADHYQQTIFSRPILRATNKIICVTWLLYSPAEHPEAPEGTPEVAPHFQLPGTKRAVTESRNLEFCSFFCKHLVPRDNSNLQETTDLLWLKCLFIRILHSYLKNTDLKQTLQVSHF